MDKTMLKKLLKTYKKRFSLKVKERECLDVEISGLDAIVKKLEEDLELLEEEKA